MDKSHCNKAIRCTVDQCANHSSGAEYCALDCITVGTHEANPTVYRVDRQKQAGYTGTADILSGKPVADR